MSHEAFQEAALENLLASNLLTFMQLESPEEDDRPEVSRDYRKQPTNV